MFIYGYFVITISKHRRPTFPARCVGCGKAASAYKIILSTPSPNDHPLRYLAWSTIEAPAHEDCAKRLLYAHYLHSVGVSVAVPPIILVMYMIFGVGIRTILLAMFIVCLLLMVAVYLWFRSRWKQKDPLPFRFSSYFDEVSYAFLDKGYAEEFAHLNNTGIDQG